MSRCEEIRPLIYPYLDRELGDDRAEGVRRHLEVCPECERRAGVETRFLARVAEAGRETAPDSLRSRVEKLLGGEQDDAETAPVPARAPGWRRLFVPVAAAAAVALLLLRPWDDVPPSARAASFAADHTAHAVNAPSENPFPVETIVPPPPPLTEARLTGLSECVVDGIVYAHYAYTVGDSHLSVFLPLGDAPRPEFVEAREGSLAIVSVESAGTAPGGAVLVSGELDAGELQAIWSGV